MDIQGRKKMANKATYIGEIQSVDGTTVSISLSTDCISGLTYVNGEGYKIGQVGSFVRFPWDITIYSVSFRK